MEGWGGQRGWDIFAELRKLKTIKSTVKRIAIESIYYELFKGFFFWDF